MYTFNEEILSDLHKDAYGFRPRSEEFWSAWDTADNDGKQRIWDDLCDAVARQIDYERKLQQKAIGEFESRVRLMMSTIIGCQRADAIRHLHDVYNTYGSVETLEFELGLPYGYISGRNCGLLA